MINKIKKIIKEIEKNHIFFNSIMVNTILILGIIIFILLFYNDNINNITKNKFDFIARNSVNELFNKEHKKITNLPVFNDGIKQIVYYNNYDKNIKEPIFISNLKNNIYYYPIKLKAKCLDCHKINNENHTVGLLKLIQDKKPINNSEILKMFLKYFFILLIFIAILFIYYKKIYIKEYKKILTKFFKSLNEEILKIKTFQELEEFEIDKNKNNIEGFNTFIKNYQSKIKTITYDKTLMNFQLDLLETFIITTEVIDNWIEYLKQIFIKLDKLVKINLLYTILKIDNNKYEVIILWKYKPNDNIKKAIENDILLKFNNKKLILIFKHKIIFENETILNNDFFIKSINLKKCNTKSFITKKHCIGGVLGVGFDSDDQFLKDNEKIKHMMLKNVLTVLINLIGSIKTINNYVSNINNLATRDNLTNLLNRRVFYELAEIKLKTAKRHKKKFSLLFIDVDNFKIINDNYGHSEGDIFLKQLAKILKNNVREEDIIVRYGGDEFIILLKEENIEQSQKIIERIQCDLETYKKDKINNIPKEITLSIGIVEYPTHGDNIEELLIIADEMMYKSKKDGKNQVVICNPLLLADLVEKNKIKKKLIFEAIKNYSLIPYFQQIKSINNNEEIYELLMRIKLGNDVLKAEEFIEIAENTGLINELDLQLFEKALSYLNDKNYKGKLFVNVSPKSLMAYNYIEKLLLIINKYNIRKENIVFEITERDTVKNIVSLERLIKELNEQNFKFAIDDFGSGFSSFMYIKKFKIDYLKIDGSFINHILESKEDIIFVKSIIYMAKELNIKVIAEFVENKETYDLLKTLKVDYIQGYYIEKPKPFI